MGLLVQGPDLEAYVGIDLGTSNSCIAILRNERVEIIPNEHGEHTTPSCVSFTDTERIVGLAAKNRSVLDSPGTIRDIKQLMGRRYDDPVTLDAIGRLPFQVVNRHGRPAVQVRFKGDTCVFTPEQISAMVLSKLKLMAENYLGLSTNSRIACVVTVPSTFDVYQRQSTMDACTIAGFHVLRAVPEPTAAAFAYNLATPSHPETLDNSSDTYTRSTNTYGGSTYLVLDLGGGTLGITILELDNGVCEVLATEGDNQLGGVNFDLMLMQFLADDFDSLHNTFIQSDNRAMSRLRLAAERAKCILSSASETTVEFETLHQGFSYSKKVTRVMLEFHCGDLIRSIVPVLDRAFHRGANTPSNHFDRDSIKDILLVGGSTRIPAVQKLVSEYFGGKEPKKHLNPDESAASGAAILAATLHYHTRLDAVDDVLLLDSLSYSLRLCGNLGPISDPPAVDASEPEKVSASKRKPRSREPAQTSSSDMPRRPETNNEGSVSLSSSDCCTIAPKGSIIPTKKNLNVRGMLVREQNVLIVSLYEGEGSKARANLLICRFEHEISSYARQSPYEIEIELDIDMNYDFDLTIHDKMTGLKHFRKIDRSRHLLSTASRAKMQEVESNMKLLDIEDTERATLKSTLESEAYLLEEKLEHLNVAGSMKADIGTNSISRRCLAWLEQNPRAPQRQYRAWLEDVRHMLAAVASTVLEQSIDTPIIPQVIEAPQYQTTSRSPVDSHDGKIASKLNNIAPLPPDLFFTHDVERIRADMPPTPLRSPLGSPPSPAAGEAKLVIQSAPVSSSESSQSNLRPSSSAEHSQLSDASRRVSSTSNAYTDQDMQDVSSSLLNMNHDVWSTIPRIYTVLRRTGDLQHIDKFVQLGITDIWLPFSITSLPETLPPSARTRFVDTQSIVLTMALELERGGEGRHVNFGHGDFVPYEVIARLGTGSYGYVDKVVSTISHREHARKVFRRKRMFSKHQEDIKNFKNELAILKRVSHQHCVELVSPALKLSPQSQALILYKGW